MDRGDRGFWAVPEPHDDVETVGQFGAQRLEAGCACLRIKVEPRGKRAAGAGQHDHMHRLIGLRTVERPVQIAHHRRIDRIELVGTVQGQGRHGRLCIVDDGRFGHWHHRPEPSCIHADFSCV